MRLARIRLDAWGHYERGASLEFPRRSRDLHVLRGDNEAGKSTLLDALTSLLFGIDKGTGRGFLWGDANLSLTGEGVLADGRPLAWSRRAGRKAPFSGTLGGGVIDAARYAALLGGVDRRQWSALFGFSGEQLARAGEALQHIPLSQVVSGSADPRGLAAALAKDADALYKGGNRAKSPRVNTEADQIRDLLKRAEAESVLPRRWRALEAAEAQARDALGAARARHHAAEANRTLATRRLAAWALLVDKTRLTEERALLGPLQEVAPGERRLYEEWMRRLDELTTSLGLAGADLAAREQERAGIVVPAEILAAAADVDRLVADHRARQEDEARLSRLVGQIHEERGVILARAAQLVPAAPTVPALPDPDGPDPDSTAVTRLAAIPTDNGTRAWLAGLARTALDIEQRRARLAAEQTRLVGERAALSERQRQLPAMADVSALETLIERGAAIREARRTLSQDQEGLERLRVQRDHQRALLGVAWPAGRPEPGRLPAPAEVDEAERALERSSRRIDEAEAARTAAEGERARHRAELDALDRTRELPTPEQLATLRAERGGAWEPVKRALLVGPPPSPMQAQALVQPFEAAVQRVDDHADAMFTEAQAVARRVHVSTLVEHADARVVELAQAARQRREEHTDLKATWAARCEAAGLLAVSPGVLRAWLRDQAAWYTTTAEHGRLEARVTGIASTIYSFEADLRATAGATSPVAPVDVLLRQTEARVKAATVAAGERRGMQEQEAALARDDARRHIALEALEGDERRFRDDTSAVRQRLTPPAGLAVGDWPAWLNEVGAGQEALRRVTALEGEEVTLRARLGAWQEDVRHHLSPLLPLPAGTPIHACVDAAARALTDARRQREQARHLDTLLPRLRESVARLRAERDEVQGKLEAARARTGAGDDATWLAQAHAAERAATIGVELGRVQAALDQLRGELPAADAPRFEASVLTSGVDLLRAELEQETAAVEAANAAVDAATRDHQDAHAELARIDTSARAAWLRTEAEEQRQRLRADVEEWVTLQLANRALGEALRRYEAGEEPAVYRRTGELFARMTDGRYVEVRPAGGHHLLHALRADGEELDSAQLSEGTRQQLYLAARLAWAERHCARFEPLPLVLDDVLAAFDDNRARATIAVLAELSERVQVILLTHHPHVSQLVQGVEPDATPTRLGVAG